MKKPSVSFELWTVNKWLRWTGWRLYVEVGVPPGSAPTKIGLIFYGWKDLP